MAMTTESPVGATPMAQSPLGTPMAGLPPEQLYTWLEWVQDDLRRVDAQLQTLEAARSQLREQERLLGELLSASGASAQR